MLKRRRASRSPRIALAIFAEGLRTEQEYFDAIKQEAENRLVKVEGGCGVPSSVVDKAIKYKKQSRRRRKNSYEQSDQIWAVFDCDDHPLEGVFEKARSNGIKVAFSNPCFEIWALLHLTDHDAPIDRHALQKMLASKMRKYDKDGAKCLDYEQMKPGYADADRRAERMHNRRAEERDSMGNPYTGVYELVRLIFQNGKKR